MSFRTPFFALVLSFLFSVSPAYAQYADADQVFVAGHPVTLTIPDADSLIITFRPGSNIAETQVVPVTEPNFKWIPREAGIVSLKTPGGPAQTVSVRFNSFPVPGFIVLIIAGGILFGGAAYASFNLFGKTSAGTVTDRPDT